MNSVSAYFDPAIRPSSRPKLAIYLVFAVIAVAFYGCGEGDKRATHVTPPTGEAATVQTDPQVAATGAVGATERTDATSSEESAFTVQIELKDGRFTRDTPRSVAIIEGVPINLEFKVRDGGRYPLVIEAESDEISKDLVLDEPGGYSEQFPALDRDEVLKVRLGDETVAITAGFEPGP